MDVSASLCGVSATRRNGKTLWQKIPVANSVEAPRGRTGLIEYWIIEIRKRRVKPRSSCVAFALQTPRGGALSAQAAIDSVESHRHERRMSHVTHLALSAGQAKRYFAGAAKHILCSPKSVKIRAPARRGLCPRRHAAFVERVTALPLPEPVRRALP